MPSTPPRTPPSGDAALPLRITNLPTDILGAMFDQFRDPALIGPGRIDWSWSDTWADDERTRTLASARLACRTLYEIASPRFLPTVKVRLDTASLDRLAEISHHPHLARGVRGIEVILAYRPAELATDLARFVERRKKSLKLAQLPHSSYEELIREVWDEYLNPTPSGPRDDETFEYQAILRRAYDAYRKLHDDAVRLCATGSFAQAVASAAARMPQFGSLLIHDEGNPARRRRSAMGNEPTFHDSLEAHLLAAERWNVVEREIGGRLPPVKLLSDLPAAIGNATGVTLRSLEVRCFSSRATQGPLVPAPGELHHGCRHLENVVLNLTHSLRSPDGWSAADARVCEYVGAVTGSHSLNSASLILPEACRIGPGLCALDASRLTELCICRALFTQSEWDGLCGALGDQLKYLFLEEVGLLDGSWGPSMAILREKTKRRCEMQECLVKFLRLTGAEFGDGEGEGDGHGRWVNVDDWHDIELDAPFVV